MMFFRHWGHFDHRGNDVTVYNRDTETSEPGVGEARAGQTQVSPVHGVWPTGHWDALWRHHVRSV